MRPSVVLPRRTPARISPTTAGRPSERASSPRIRPRGAPEVGRTHAALERGEETALDLVGGLRLAEMFAPGTMPRPPTSPRRRDGMRSQYGKALHTMGRRLRRLRQSSWGDSAVAAGGGGPGVAPPLACPHRERGRSLASLEDAGRTLTCRWDGTERAPRSVPCADPLQSCWPRARLRSARGPAAPATK